MSLRGTLDTLAVPDLLTLLAATKRSGELTVHAPGFEGRLWLADGGLLKADVPDSSDLVDAVFCLLRLQSGDFTFEAEAGPLRPTDAASMAAVLSEAEARLTEWLAFTTAVPTLQVRFRLVPEPVGATVTVTAGEWRLLATLADGKDLGGAMEALGLSELDARRAVKNLIDAGALAKAPDGEAGPQPSAPPPTPEPDQGTPPPTSEPEPSPPLPAAAPLDQEARERDVPDEVPSAETEAYARPRGEDEPVSRSLLLRYLSGESY